MLLFRYFNISHKNVVYKRQEILFLFNFERLQQFLLNSALALRKLRHNLYTRISIYL